MSIRGLLNLYGQSKLVSRHKASTALRLQLVQKIHLNLLKTVRNIAQKQNKFKDTKFLRKRKKNRRDSSLEQQEKLLVNWLSRMRRQQRLMNAKYQDENRIDRRLRKLRKCLKCCGMADEFIPNYFSELRSVVQRRDEGVSGQAPKLLSPGKFQQLLEGNAENAQVTVDKLEHFMKSGRNPRLDTFLHVNLSRFPSPHLRAKKCSRVHKPARSLEIKRLVASLKKSKLGYKQDRRDIGQKGRINSFESLVMHFLDGYKKNKLENKRLKGGESNNLDGLNKTARQGPYKVPGRSSKSVEKQAVATTTKQHKRSKGGSCKKVKVSNKAKQAHKKIKRRRSSENRMQFVEPLKSQKIEKAVRKAKIIFMVVKAMQSIIGDKKNILTEPEGAGPISDQTKYEILNNTIQRMSQKNANVISRLTSEYPQLLALTLPDPFSHAADMSDVKESKRSIVHDTDPLFNEHAWLRAREEEEHKHAKVTQAKIGKDAREHDRKFSVYKPDNAKVEDIVKKMEKEIEDTLLLQNAKRFHRVIHSDAIPYSDSVLNLLNEYGENQTRYNNVLFHLPEALMAGKQKFIIQSLERHYDAVLDLIEDKKLTNHVTRGLLSDYDISAMREKWINHFMGSPRNNYQMKKIDLYDIFRPDRIKKPKKHKKIKRVLIKKSLPKSFHSMPRRHTLRMQEIIKKLEVKKVKDVKPPPPIKVCCECGMPIQKCNTPYVDSEESLMPIRVGIQNL